MKPLYPPLVDLAVESKPVPTPEIVTSDIAAAEYDAAIEAWGERGWSAVGRICRWAKAQGATLTCPEPR